MKKKVLVGVFSALLLVAGCSNSTETKKEDVKQEVKQEKDRVSKEIKQNKELTKQVKDEEGVLDGQVYTQENMAIGTLVLDKKVSDKDAKKLADKYAKELKEEYKDMKVNVQVVRDGKNVTNITLD